jgi:thioredoxin 1
MQKLTQTTFVPAVQNGLVVVDFFAERCGPCKMVAPYLDDMQSKLGDTVTFYKVDVDEEQEIAMTQGITGMPTFKIFKDGVEVKKIAWADLRSLWQGIQEQVSA